MSKAKALEDLIGNLSLFIAPPLIKSSLKGLEKLKEYLKKEELLFNGKSIKEAYMTDLLQQMILDGVSINAFPIYSPWLEIDTVSDLELEEKISRIQYIHNEISV